MIRALVPVVGRPTQTVWSQVVHLSAVSSDGVRLEELVLAISVFAKEDAREAGMEILERIEVDFQAGGGIDGPGLSDFLRERTGESEAEVVALGFLQDHLYVCGVGMVEVFLHRGGSVAAIYEGGEVWQAVGGRVRVGDQLLMGTKALTGEMSEALLLEVVGNTDLVAVGEQLSTSVHGRGDNEAVAGAVIRIEQPVAEEVIGEHEVGAETHVLKKSPAVYLKLPNKRRKTALSVGLILLVLLGMSVWLGAGRRQVTLRQERFEEVETQVATLSGQALEAAGTDPGRAGQLVREAQALVDGAMGELAKDQELVGRLEQRREELNSLYIQVSGEVEVDLPLWFDLTLIREDLRASSMAVEEGRVVVLHSGGGLLASVGVENKQTGLVGGSELSGARLMAVLGNRAIVMAETGIMEVSLSNRTSALLISPDEEWREVRMIGFYGGNVYVLDTELSEIWRYPGVAGGLSGRRRWLSVGQEPQLAQVVDMAIDGDIWLLTGDGRILRFRQGSELPFTMRNLEPGLDSPRALVVAGEREEVMVLDSGNKRVVVFDTEGTYKRQYTSEAMGEVSDMGVDEESGSLFLLSDTKIYRLDL